MNEPNETEKAFASLGITGFCNPCYMPSVEWIDGKPYYPAYAARDALEKRVAQYEKSLAKLKKNSPNSARLRGGASSARKSRMINNGFLFITVTKIMDAELN